MAALKSRVQYGLDELRMLVLGIQVFIGFGFRAVLEPGFEKLPYAAQLVKLVALSLLLVAFALTLAPGADHRICERGQDTPAFHRLVTCFASVALLPFAVALGLDVALATVGIFGARAMWVIAPVVAAVALAMWYGVELVGRYGKEQPMSADQSEKAKLEDKIHHVLTESRVVLPGAQALLGFQLATTMTAGFEKLPQSLKVLHFCSLSAVALSTIFLITPAAWHRLVERGEETERFHRFASAMVLAALVPLALGMCGDFYLVADRITASPTAAAILAAGLALVFFALWFGLGLVRRAASLGAPTPRWVET